MCTVRGSCRSCYKAVCVGEQSEAWNESPDLLRYSVVGMLSESIRRFVEQEFPGVELTPLAGFWPMPSLANGELSSRAAIEVARSTKQNAKEIADRLIELLSSEVKAEWRNDQGYVVCWGMSRDLFLSAVDCDVSSALARLGIARVGGSRQVWCLIPDSTAPAYARVRLVARVALQAVLAVVYEGSCVVRMHPCAARQVTTIGAVVEVFQEAVEWILEHEGEARIDPLVPSSAEELSVPCSVWTTHHYHERFSREVRSSFAALRARGGVSLVMPADGWLLSRDRALSEVLHSAALGRVISRLDSCDDWYHFLFHAAGTIPSGDFDPAVALFEESASPLWNLRVLVERYRRFGDEYSFPVSKAKAEVLIADLPEPRELVVRPLLLPAYCAQAIVHAELGPFCEALERMGQRGHAFINAPETRLALERSVLNSNTGKIAAGLGFGLSCIMPLVVEDACEDR